MRIMPAQHSLSLSAASTPLAEGHACDMPVAKMRTPAVGSSRSVCTRASCTQLGFRQTLCRSHEVTCQIIKLACHRGCKPLAKRPSRALGRLSSVSTEMDLLGTAPFRSPARSSCSVLATAGPALRSCAMKRALCRQLLKKTSDTTHRRSDSSCNFWALRAAARACPRV